MFRFKWFQEDHCTASPALPKHHRHAFAAQVDARCSPLERSVQGGLVHRGDIMYFISDESLAKFHKPSFDHFILVSGVIDSPHRAAPDSSCESIRFAVVGSSLAPFKNIQEHHLPLQTGCSSPAASYGSYENTLTVYQRSE